MTIADTDAKEKQELGLVVGVGGLTSILSFLPWEELKKSIDSQPCFGVPSHRRIGYFF